jgi:hypothetical protein
MAKKESGRPAEKVARLKKPAPKPVRYFSDDLGMLAAGTARAVAAAARSKEVKGIGRALAGDARAAGRGLAQALQSASKSKGSRAVKTQARHIVSGVKKRRGQSWVRQGAGAVEDILELGKRVVHGAADAAESDYVRHIPGAAARSARSAGRQVQKVVRAARASGQARSVRKHARKLWDTGSQETRSAMRSTGEAVRAGVAMSSGAFHKGAGYLRSAKK